MDKTTALYRMFDADRRLLYVGISGRLPSRFAEHQGEKPWWANVASITVEHFDDRIEAIRAETNAIKSERPLYNIRHAPAVEACRKFTEAEKLGELERWTLGAALLHPQCASTLLSGAIEEDDFTLPQHAAVFGALRDLYLATRRNDAISVAAYLHAVGTLDADSVVPLVRGLLRDAPDLIDIEEYGWVVVAIQDAWFAKT